MGVIVSGCAFSTIIRLESVCVRVIVLGCGFSVTITDHGVFAWVL